MIGSTSSVVRSLSQLQRIQTGWVGSLRSLHPSVKCWQRDGHPWLWVRWQTIFIVYGLNAAEESRCGWKLVGKGDLLPRDRGEASASSVKWKQAERTIGNKQKEASTIVHTHKGQSHEKISLIRYWPKFVGFKGKPSKLSVAAPRRSQPTNPLRLNLSTSWNTPIFALKLYQPPSQVLEWTVSGGHHFRGLNDRGWMGHSDLQIQGMSAFAGWTGLSCNLWSRSLMLVVTDLQISWFSQGSVWFCACLLGLGGSAGASFWMHRHFACSSKKEPRRC